MQLLDGKKTSKEIKLELAKAVKLRKESGKKIPHLAAVLVGSDGGSMTYVNAKVKACEEIGFESTLIKYDDSVSEEILLSKVKSLNEDKSIDGFIVQLPLPKHIDELKITQAIDPKKDVDGFHPVNLGNMILNIPCFLPATPAGIMELLKRNNIETKGKNCLIIGRSNIVGQPLSILLAQNTNPGNCTVTLAHSHTKNLKDWNCIAEFSKDIFPMPHFKWGVVSFSDGDQESESFTLHFEGLKKVDGKAYLCSIN